MQLASVTNRGFRILRQEGVTGIIVEVITELVRYVESIIALLFGAIVPKNDNLIVFANRSENCEFSGNMKYLYLELANEYDKNCMWITGFDEIETLLSENGYNVCKTNSLKARISLCRAKYAITDVDFHTRQWSYLLSATTVQLWHGYPLKKLPKENRGKLAEKIQVFDYACINNSVEEAELRNHKNIDESYYTGYPRNDLFFREIHDAELGVNSKAKEIFGSIPQGDTLIGYLPTWRENEEIPPLELEKFNTFLENHDAHCIIKPHPYTPPFVDDSEFERVHLHPPTGDIYPLFDNIDILLTDFSSIYFDYLFLDRPVAFYPYDYESYIKNRGLNLDYHTATPGPKSFTFDELLTDLSSLLANDSYQEEREELVDEVFCDYNGHAIRDIYERIL